MTKQQIKDYEKVQPLDILKMWLDCVPEFKNCQSVEELPLSCAISDIDSLADNLFYEIQHCNYEEWLVEYKKQLRYAKWFLKKYKA